jgi:integrase
VPGSNRRRKPRRIPGERYDTTAYARAIADGCAAAFPPPESLVRQRVPAHGRKQKSQRWETVQEWRDRLGGKQWDELIAWRQAHRWHPHQLRHTAGSRLRREFGLEAAQVILGHRNVKVTELYAEANVEAAKRIMGKVG